MVTDDGHDGTTAAVEAALAWCLLAPEEAEPGAAIFGAVRLVAAARRFVELEVAAGSVSAGVTKPVAIELEAGWAWTGTAAP